MKKPYSRVRAYTITETAKTLVKGARLLQDCRFEDREYILRELRRYRNLWQKDYHHAFDAILLAVENYFTLLSKHPQRQQSRSVESRDEGSESLS